MTTAKNRPHIRAVLREYLCGIYPGWDESGIGSEKMKIDAVHVEYRPGGAVLAFDIPVSDMRQANKVVNVYKPGGEYDITVKKHRRRRSISANGYLWC